jgi:hypothetical protein
LNIAIKRNRLKSIYFHVSESQFTERRNPRGFVMRRREGLLAPEFVAE